MSYTIKVTNEDGYENQTWAPFTDLALAVETVCNLREDGDGSDRFELIHTDTGAVVTRGEVRRAGIKF